MSLHYILDGYNIIKQIPQLSLKELKAARQGFYSFIETYRPQGSPKNKITVVFDGKAEVGSHTEGSCAEVIRLRPDVSSGLRRDFADGQALELIFSKGRNADEEIKAIIRQVKNPAIVVLVSDDRQLKLEARSLGAKVMSVSEFINKGRGKTKKHFEGKDIPLTVEYKINTELRRIWLKAKK